MTSYSDGLVYLKCERWCAAETSYNKQVCDSADCIGCGSAEYHLHWTHRATAHALMLVLGASFVLLMPSRPTRFSAHGAHGLYAYMLQVPYLNFYVLPFKWGPCASTVALLKLEGAMLPLTLALSVVAAYVLTSAPVRKATCFMMDPTWANRLVGLARDTERRADVKKLIFLLAACFSAAVCVPPMPEPVASRSAPWMRELTEEIIISAPRRH